MDRQAGSATRASRRLLPALSCAALLALAGGCDQSLTIPDRFPAPLVEPLPISVALYLPDDLTRYHYHEAVPDHGDWDIELGKANAALFDSVSSRLFRSAVRVASLAEGRALPGVDAIVEPSVAGFEFSLPSQSATDLYAVWIRYTLKVYTPDGQVLTTWTVSAYGESDASSLQSTRSMQRATTMALRDAAATISLDFARQAKVREVLLKETADAPEPETATIDPAGTGEDGSGHTASP